MALCLFGALGSAVGKYEEGDTKDTRIPRGTDQTMSVKKAVTCKTEALSLVRWPYWEYDGDDGVVTK